MKLDSKYFDQIRIKPRVHVAEERRAPAEPRCESPGCAAPGGYRAPKGRNREGQYFNFCLDHVRDYNKSYNYFAGMTDHDIDAYRVDAATGHRPTWTMGARAGHHVGEGAGAEQIHDVFGVFPGFGHRTGGGEEPGPRERPLGNVDRKSFATLDLEGREDRATIKSRFKELVKRLHPDANGGDRSSEDRLREIIQAYNHLKAAGYC
ncbi:MAG: J domain-containing protein [Bauldia sp.]|jgi:hypothetical protein